MAKQLRPMTYRRAIDWLISNGDYDWAFDGPVTITAGFIADCFHKTTQQVRLDVLTELVRAGYADPAVLAAIRNNEQKGI
jgi:hypothetical protein